MFQMNLEGFIAGDRKKQKSRSPKIDAYLYGVNLSEAEK